MDDDRLLKIQQVQDMLMEAIRSLPEPLSYEALGQYPTNKQYWLRRARSESQGALYTAYEALHIWAEQINSDSPQDWGLLHRMLKKMEGSHGA